MQKYYTSFLVFSLLIGNGIKISHIYHYHLDECQKINSHDYFHDSSHHLEFFDLSILPIIENSFSWNHPWINQNQKKIRLSQNEYLIQRFFQFISLRAPPY